MKEEEEQKVPITNYQLPLKFNAYIKGVKKQIEIDKNQLKTEGVKINTHDMIGFILKQKTTEGYLQYSLYSYPRRKKLFSSERRYVEQISLQIRDFQNWQNIQKSIVSLINNRGPQQSLKLLICFNSNAGSNSKKHLNNILKFIKYTNLQPEIFATKHRNHCLEHLKTINKNQYCGIAIVSGDGLMHQYVNSLCEVPVTHVPAGSGNAFAKTQMQYAKQLCKDQESIFLVIKNNVKKFNLTKFQLQKVKEPIYSFLSLEWAIIADLDMNSQFLRCLGSLRFEVYALYLLLKMKRYRGRLTYSTIQKQMPPLETNLQNNPNYITVQDSFVHTIFCTIPYISQKYKIAPLLNLDQQYIDMQFLTRNTGRVQLAKYLLSSDSGGHFDAQQRKPVDGFKFHHRMITSFRLEPLDAQMPGVFGIDGQSYQSQRIQASFSDRNFNAFI